jgi:aspartyl-tRNA(Asn)/glutamyl-tRNA(Gln) amidotransferase subunit C
MINKKSIEKIARLSRIRLEDNEVEVFHKEFEDILESFEKIKSVNTDNIKPSFQPFKIESKLREDVSEKSLSQKEVLQNKENEKGFFKGPRAV